MCGSVGADPDMPALQANIHQYLVSIYQYHISNTTIPVLHVRGSVQNETPGKDHQKGTSNTYCVHFLPVLVGVPKALLIQAHNCFLNYV